PLFAPIAGIAFSPVLDALAVFRPAEVIFVLWSLLPAALLLGAYTVDCEQQQVAIARALMSRPDLLLLDEPSMGVTPKLVTEIFHTVEHIAGEGVTVLLVEQNVFEALQVCRRAYVLQTGRIVMEGTGSELLRSDLVRKAYLGM